MILHQFIEIDGWIMEWLFPFSLVNSIWNINKLFRFHAVLNHVLFCERQEGNNIVAVPVAVIFCFLHHTDIRMLWAHAAKFNRAEWPKIMHFINQHGTVFFCQSPCGVDIQRVGGRGNYGVRFSLCGNLRGIFPQSVQKRKHIPDASHVVTMIFISSNPKIANTINILFTEFFSRQIWILCAKVGKGTSNYRNPVAFFHPVLCHLIWAEFHAMLCRACIVVNINDVHFFAPRSG